MVNHWEMKLHVDLHDMKKIHPCLGVVFYEFVLYCMTHNLPCIVTSVLDKAKKRSTDTHPTGRAIDCSTKVHWDDDTFHRERIMYHLNKKYGEKWGTSGNGKDPKVLVYHDAGNGTGKHFHFQVRKKLTWEHL